MSATLKLLSRVRPTVLRLAQLQLKTLHSGFPGPNSCAARLLPVQSVFYERQLHTSVTRLAEKQIYTYQTVKDRVLLVCKLFDKINAEKLTLDSHFMKDLGLDSLDHVEVIMQLEDEFAFEIADGDAERLLTPREIIQYICDKEDVYE